MSMVLHLIASVTVGETIGHEIHEALKPIQKKASEAIYNWRTRKES